MGATDLEQSSLTATVLSVDRYTKSLIFFSVFLISPFLDADDIDKNDDDGEGRWNFSLH